jgi:hypothetical protein
MGLKIPGPKGIEGSIPSTRIMTTENQYLKKAETWLEFYHNAVKGNYNPVAICVRLLLATDNLVNFWKEQSGKTRI